MSYVAVTGQSQVEGAGAIVWWKVNGTIECKALAEAWEKRVDLDPELLKNPPTPGAALRRALARHAKATKVGGKKGKLIVSGLGEDNAYAIVHETTPEEGFEGEPVHETFLKVRLYEHDASSATPGRIGLDMLVYPGCPQHIPTQVQADYEANLTTFSGTEISEWFSLDLLPAFHAVSLRKQGGMWFVPATHLALWYDAVGAVREVSGHQIYKIPAYSTDADSVEGILDALAEEALEEAQKMEDEILATDMTPAKLRNRVSKLEQVTAKVVSYENMLGAKLPKLTERLESLNAQMAAAIFTAEAAKDQEAA